MSQCFLFTKTKICTDLSDILQDHSLLDGCSVLLLLPLRNVFVFILHSHTNISTVESYNELIKTGSAFDLVYIVHQWRTVQFTDYRFFHTLTKLQSYTSILFAAANFSLA